MVSIFDPASTAILVLLAITAVLGFASSTQLLKKSFELKDARKVFLEINVAFLLSLILISIDEVLKFNVL